MDKRRMLAEAAAKVAQDALKKYLAGNASRTPKPGEVWKVKDTAPAYRGNIFIVTSLASTPDVAWGDLEGVGSMVPASFDYLEFVMGAP
jgi:hypothetical protein